MTASLFSSYMFASLAGASVSGGYYGMATFFALCCLIEIEPREK